MAALLRLAAGAGMAIALAATCTSAGVRVVGPFPPASPPVGYEVGVRALMSMPTGPAHDAFDHGFGVGLTTTSFQTRRLGVGLDFGYFRLPAPKVGAVLDGFFSALGRAPVRGTKVMRTEFQSAGHLRVALLPGARVVPWVQAGAGIDRVNLRLEFPVDQLAAAGWRAQKASSDDIGFEMLFLGGVGLDLQMAEGMRVGLDASYQRQLYSAQAGAFTAFTLGGHVVFGHR